MTKKIGGEPYEKMIDFMSSHINYYPALVNDSSFNRNNKTNRKGDQ